MQVLKTDVLWVNYLKHVKSSSIRVKNAFKICRLVLATSEQKNNNLIVIITDAIF